MEKKFILHVHIENDAFQDGNCGQELARILKDVAKKIENETGDDITFFQTVRDINGNDVGRFAIKYNDYK